MITASLTSYKIESSPLGLSIYLKETIILPIQNNKQIRNKCHKYNNGLGKTITPPHNTKKKPAELHI